MRNTLLATFLLVLVVALSGRPASSSRLLRGSVNASAALPSVPTSLWQLIQARSDLTSLKQIVQAASLTAQLDDVTTAYTMFMPNDDAFDEYFSEVGGNLTGFLKQQSNATLAALVLYHLHAGPMLVQANITAGMTINMVKGGNVSAALYWDMSTVLRDAAGRTANIVDADLRVGSKAVGHATDRVFISTRPNTLQGALALRAEFSSFLTALQAGGYSAVLTNTTEKMTFLVPTDDAFADALETLNMTFADLLANKTLLSSIVSTHIVPAVNTWSLYNTSQLMYFATSNSCVNFYAESDGSGALVLYGSGSAADTSANLVEADLYAGKYALIQVLDAVLLPLAKWGSRCRYTGQTPS